jgi:hypothetical protein
VKDGGSDFSSECSGVRSGFAGQIWVPDSPYSISVRPPISDDVRWWGPGMRLVTITPFINLIGVVTSVGGEVALVWYLYFPCKVPLNNLNKKSCMHHFDAEAGVEPLFWKKEGDWYSLIQCYPIWYCIWFHSSYYQKESYINSIITGLGSFVKGTVWKRILIG